MTSAGRQAACAAAAPAAAAPAAAAVAPSPLPPCRQRQRAPSLLLLHSPCCDGATWLQRQRQRQRRWLQTPGSCGQSGWPPCSRASIDRQAAGPSQQGPHHTPVAHSSYLQRRAPCAPVVAAQHRGKGHHRARGGRVEECHASDDLRPLHRAPAVGAVGELAVPGRGAAGRQEQGAGSRGGIHQRLHIGHQARGSAPSLNIPTPCPLTAQHPPSRSLGVPPQPPTQHQHPAPTCPPRP